MCRIIGHNAEFGNDLQMMKDFSAALLRGLFILVPAALSAGPFDGTYKQTANAECSLVGVDGGSLRIEENIFYGVEVECRMTLFFFIFWLNS